MRYITELHKNKVWIRPKPEEDIPEGLVLLLNQPITEGSENFMVRDIEAGVKGYLLPELPEGVFINGAFVRNK